MRPSWPVPSCRRGGVRPTDAAGPARHTGCVNPPRLPAAATVVLVAAQWIVAAILASTIISVGYRYAGVSSFDELPKLGNGPALGLATSLGLPLLLTPLALVLLATRFRPFTWAVPVLGMLASIALWFYAVSTFEQPINVGG